MLLHSAIRQLQGWKKISLFKIEKWDFKKIKSYFLFKSDIF